MLNLQLTNLSKTELGFSARLVPFGHQIKHDGQMVKFEKGDISVSPGLVPVVIGHDYESPLARVGKVSRTFETVDALYVDVELSDTADGRDIRTLLADGVLTDVSAGIVEDSKMLHHVGIVGYGAFAEAGEGSKVLQVHNKETEEMEEENTEDTEVQLLTSELSDLRKVIMEMQVPGAVTDEAEKVSPFADMKDFVLTYMRAQKGDAEAGKKVAEFVLADDTTTTAAGLVPDYYSREIIGLIDDFRPYLAVPTKDPIGDQGMTIQYPRRTQKPDVDVQATQKTEVATQATTFDFMSEDLVTYAGASDVSMQLIERSAPSFVTRLFQELAGVYAERTDAAAVADAVTGAGLQTAIVADLGADAAATWAAIATGAGVIAGSVKRPASHLVVATDRWTELLQLVDTDGRPLIAPNNPQNTQGAAGLDTFTFDYGGLQGIVDPQAADGTCLLMWKGATAYVEQTPQQLRTVQTSLLGVDMGVWGLFAHIVKYPGGLYTLTAA